MKSSTYLLLASVLWLSSCSSRPEGLETILIKGSDTEVNVALALAEQYMEQEAKVSIAVTGGGSGMGIAALINGKTDIANSSRPMKTEEIELAQDRGIHPVATVFATDALAIVTHPSNPVASINLDELSQIYSGQLQNWQTLGGPDRPISLYGRQSNSGTFVYFRDEVVRAEYSPDVKQMNGTAQIIEAIKQDEAGIGYVGVGYLVDKTGTALTGVKILPVQGRQDSAAVSPLILEHIKSGTYALTRPLFQYTDGVPDGQLLRFMQFVLSETGQALIEENGYYPVSPKDRASNPAPLSFKNN